MPKLLIGIGSHHGWDRLGWLVAQEMATRNLPGLEVRLATTPWNVLDWLAGYSEIHLCDTYQAMNQSADAHTHDHVEDCVEGLMIQRWQWPDPRLQNVRHAGTHDMSLATILELADQLKLTVCPITIWGLPIPNAVMSFEAAELPRVVSGLTDQLQLHLATASVIGWF